MSSGIHPQVPLVPGEHTEPIVNCPGWCAQVITSIFGWQVSFEKKFDDKIGQLFARSEANALAIAKLSELTDLKKDVADLKSWKDKAMGVLAAVIILSNVIGGIIGIIATHYWPAAK